MRARGLLGCVVLAGLLPGVVGGAQASGGPRPVLLDLPAPAGLTQARLVDGVPQQPERAVDVLARADTRDAGALLAAAARAAALVDPGAPEGEVVAVGAPGFSVPAGDLDGDGLVDLLTYDGAELADLVLTARRGLDGRVLWERRVGVEGLLAFPLARDLDGDGADDLLVDAFDVVEVRTSEEGALGRSERYTSSFTHRVGLLGGRDGRLLWQRTVDGSAEVSQEATGDPAGLTREDSFTLTARNLAALPLLSEDVDGDGLPDLVLNEVDLDVEGRVRAADAVVAAVADASYRLRSATRARLVGGSDGVARQELTAVDQRGLALLLPVGQVVGSPSADLVWALQEEVDGSATCARTVAAEACPREDLQGRSAATTVLLDGATGATAWESTVAGLEVGVRGLGVDVEGDGVPDLVRPVVDLETGNSLTQVLSGQDGRVVWEVPGGFFPADLLAVEDGVAVVAQVDADGPGLALRLQRRDAVAGAVLQEERREAPRTSTGEPEGGGFRLAVTALLYGPVPDADARGTGEVLVAGLAETLLLDEDFQEVERDAASDTAYLPLLGGTPVFEERSQDLRLVLPSGDLDGDGLLDARRDVVRDDRLVDSTALRLQDGSALWRSAGDPFALPFAAGDLDGAAGEELVQDLPGAVRSLRGDDLSLRWESPTGR